MLEHELGHVIGLADNSQAGDLMDITLGLGIRRDAQQADLAAIVSSSTTAGAVKASVPVPAVAVPLSQPYPSNGAVLPATVDAALASMLSAGAGSGDDHDSTASVGSVVRSSDRSSSLKITIRRKGHTAQSSPRYPDGALTSRFGSRSINASIRKDRRK